MRCGMWGCERDIKGDFQGVGGCTFYSYRGDRERHIWRNKVKLCFSRVKLEMRIRFLNIVFSWCQSCRYVCECMHMNVKKWDWVKRALDRMSRCLVWGVGKRKKIKQKPMWLWACNLIFFLLLLLSRFSCVRLCATPLTWDTNCFSQLSLGKIRNVSNEGGGRENRDEQCIMGWEGPSRTPERRGWLTTAQTRRMSRYPKSSSSFNQNITNLLLSGSLLLKGKSYSRSQLIVYALVHYSTL